LGEKWKSDRRSEKILKELREIASAIGRSGWLERNLLIAEKIWKG